MRNFVKAAGLAGMVALGLTAAIPGLQAAAQSDRPTTARPLHEGEGVVTKVSDTVSAVTYWASESDGWHVVTTIDSVTGQGSKAEQHAIIRVSGLLQPGQSQVISVPAAVNEPSPSLRISRTGNRINVERVSALSD
ncbi:MAG: hypothetical protein ABWY00_15610 [Dongiaceae bacterium]